MTHVIERILGPGTLKAKWTQLSEVRFDRTDDLTVFVGEYRGRTLRVALSTADMRSLPTATDCIRLVAERVRAADSILTFRPKRFYRPGRSRWRARFGR